MCNAIGFLCEMVSEDNPFNDHSELLNKRSEVINKHYHIKRSNNSIIS
jgi:hypothetical protein